MHNINESIDIEQAWHDIGIPTDFPDGDVAAVSADGIEIAVFRVGDELFALKDKCTHGRAKLSEGFVEDGCVECPLHQGRFAIRTGEPMGEPVVKGVKSFPVRVVAGRVEVQTAA